MRKALWIPLVLAAFVVVGVGTVFAWPRGTARAQSSDASPRQAKAYLGVQVATITEALSQRLGLPIGGVVVVRVLPGSPAEAAGLQRGDVLTQATLGTTTVALQRPADLTTLLRNAQPGQQVTLTLQRGGQSRTVTISLGQWPQPPIDRGHDLGKPGLPFPKRGRMDSVLRGQVTLQQGTTTVTYAFFGGTVSATSTNAIVVTPLDGSAPVTVNVTDQVRVVGCPRGEGANLAVGSRVVVVSQDGVVRWVKVLGPCGAGEHLWGKRHEGGGPIRIQPVPQRHSPVRGASPQGVNL
ncbi:MAG: PDZ domain-containing protein [Dehalococcoidia bacterium]|nr:PDZ domain-containing protein [Dehalococcoidia bacterium]MDW8119721.1 PDZ domain-containing protein [Chloroflexota bacterium]